MPTMAIMDFSMIIVAVLAFAGGTIFGFIATVRCIRCCISVAGSVRTGTVDAAPDTAEIEMLDEVEKRNRREDVHEDLD